MPGASLNNQLISGAFEQSCVAYMGLYGNRARDERKLCTTFSKA